jgi:hypothetical protein
MLTAQTMRIILAGWELALFQMAAAQARRGMGMILTAALLL